MFEFYKLRQTLPIILGMSKVMIIKPSFRRKLVEQSKKIHELGTAYSMCILL